MIRRTAIGLLEMANGSSEDAVSKSNMLKQINHHTYSVSMKEIAIVVDYKASGGLINGLEEFKRALREQSVVSVRPNRQPQSGGLWEVFVEFYVNTDFSDFIIGALLWDIGKAGAKKFLFDSIAEAFEKLEKENENLDYRQVMYFTFDDVQLRFYGLNQRFFVPVHECLKILFKHYQDIKSLSDKDLFTIHIPAYRDNENADRDIYLIDSYREPSQEELTTYWALSYTVDHQRDVLDVRNMKLLDKDWEREGQTFKSR